jgi:Arc/MetJ family transcription regulator
MAGTNANVKVGVSGIAQFKQNMNQAKQAVKTLDAQLALTEKQFKASGDAESYMIEKGELLKAKLKQQEAVVQSAEKALQAMTERGVERSSKAYQDMYRQMVNAKGEMIDTKQALENIGTAAEDAEVSVSGMEESLQGIGKNISLDTIQNALKSLTGGMEAIMQKALRVGKVITQEVLGAGSWADDLASKSEYYGIEEDELQRIEKTADLIDTSVDAIVGAKKRMKQNLGAGSADTIDALDALGLGNIVDTDPEEMFWKIGDAIMNLGDEYQREDKAQKLFGRGWNELIPLFRTGREEYEKLNKSWNTVPQEQIDALKEMDDQYQILKNDLETVKLTFLGELAPAAKGVMETLTGLVGEFNKYLESDDGKEMMDSLGKAVESLFTDLTKIDPKQTMQDIIGIFDSIKGGLKWIAENKRGVVTAVEAFIGAWAVLKTASGVTTVLELLNGLKWLKANPDIKLPSFGFGNGGGGGNTGGGTPGWAAAPMNFLNGASAQILKTLSPAGAIGSLLPAVFDRFLNETNIGRALRDGTDLLEGLNKDVEEFSENIEKNAETFEKDWSENILTQPGKNAILFWDQFWKNVWTGGYEQGAFADEEDWEGDANDVMAAIARMTELMENGGTESNGKKTPSWMPDLSKLPQNMKDVFLSVMGSIGVYLNGQKVGEMIAPYVDEQLAGEVYAD